MVSSAVLAVLGTLAGAIVTGVINVITTKIRQKSESERRTGEIFLEKKANVLIDLHKRLADCDTKMDKMKIKKQGNPISDLYDQDERGVKKAIDELGNSFDRSKIYLSEEEDEKIEKAILSMIMTYYHFTDSHEVDLEEALEESEIDPENRSEYVDDARNVLRSKINNPTKFAE